MDGIDKAGSAVDLTRLASTPATTGAAAPVAATPDVNKTGADASLAEQTISLLSVLADAAPPIDNKKVQAIQSLIAAGAYPIDPRAIAAKMVALDFPTSGANADA